MKVFTFVLMALVSSSAYAQTLTKTEESISGLPFWTGRADESYINDDEAIGLKANENDPQRKDEAAKYIAHLLAHGADEAECTKNLFNLAIKQTLYPDLRLQSYEQDYSLGSLVDREILNFSGFDILAGRAKGADGNEFLVTMKVNYRNRTLKTVRTEARSGKLLESTEKKTIRCYFNKGGDIGHSMIIVKNQHGDILVQVESSTLHGLGKGSFR
jgi:hypothetical protein